MKPLEEYLRETASMHKHLCPRQVLGVRMGMLAGKLLSVELPQKNKRLLTLVETDGCAVDGISVVTNCTVGHRTLRVEDYGKVAATFVDTKTQRAIRIAPRSGVRQRAYEYAVERRTRWEAQLSGYQRMPDERLFMVQEVALACSLEKIVSRPGKRVICSGCGEEIINGREIYRGEQRLCRPCAGDSYYFLNHDPELIAVSIVDRERHEHMV